MPHASAGLPPQQASNPTAGSQGDAAVVQSIRIPCVDGVELAGSFFASGESPPKAAVLIGPATGIRQGFYHAFARYLAEYGYAVLTFENRGIGASRIENGKHDPPTLEHWGRRDLTAALAELQRRTPNTSYHLIGHSAGGQLAGLMENAEALSSLLMVACSSGSLRHMRFPFRLQAMFFMNIYIPLSNALFGRTNSQWVGMGEPLPKGVAAQWNRWCSGTGYIATDLDRSIHNHHYHTLDKPSLWLYATDDGIANRVTVQDMIRVYPNLQVEYQALNPKTYGVTDIGHMKFFSSKRKMLWTLALDWLERRRT